MTRIKWPITLRINFRICINGNAEFSLNCTAGHSSGQQPWSRCFGAGAALSRPSSRAISLVPLVEQSSTTIIWVTW